MRGLFFFLWLAWFAEQIADDIADVKYYRRKENKEDEYGKVVLNSIKIFWGIIMMGTVLPIIKWISAILEGWGSRNNDDSVGFVFLLGLLMIVILFVVITGVAFLIRKCYMSLAKKRIAKRQQEKEQKQEEQKQEDSNNPIDCH